MQLALFSEPLHASTVRVPHTPDAFSSMSSMPTSPLSSISKPSASQSFHSSSSIVRQRVIQQRLEEQMSREREHTSRVARQAEAAKAREENARSVLPEERRNNWVSLLFFLRAAKSFALTNSRLRHRLNLKKTFFPIVLVRLRRWIRQCRVRLMLQNFDQPIRRPTVADLRTDRMLALFPDAHLQNMIDGAVLRYYYKDESIIFMGCEEDDCFFLASGTAEVVMNGTRVYTLTPGMMFGTVGMISGEPRTATIIGRSAVFVWAFTRSTFEQFGACSAEQLDVAKDVINQLRQQNLFSVYIRFLSPTFLGTRFPMLSHVGDDFLDQMIKYSVPEVVTEGTVISAASRNPAETDVVLLLRGKVVVSGDCPTTMPLQEHVALAVEIHDSHIRGSIAVKLTTASKVDGPIVIEGPLLLNLGIAILGEVQTLTFRAGHRGCDLLRIPRRKLMTLDVLELADLRAAALAVHCVHMPPLRKSAIHHALSEALRGELGSAAGGLLQTTVGSLQLTPRVFQAGETILFDGLVPGSDKGSDNSVLFIVRGTTDESWDSDPSVSQPILWPQLSHVLFSNRKIALRAKTRLEAFSATRETVVEAVMRHSIAPEELFSQLMMQYSDATHLYPRQFGDQELVVMGMPSNCSIVQKRLISAIEEGRQLTTKKSTENFHNVPDTVVTITRRPKSTALEDVSKPARLDSNSLGSPIDDFIGKRCPSPQSSPLVRAGKRFTDSNSAGDDASSVSHRSVAGKNSLDASVSPPPPRMSPCTPTHPRPNHRSRSPASPLVSPKEPCCSTPPLSRPSTASSSIASSSRSQMPYRNVRQRVDAKHTSQVRVEMKSLQFQTPAEVLQLQRNEKTLFEDTFGL